MTSNKIVMFTLRNNYIVTSKYFKQFCSEFLCSLFFVLCVCSNLAIFVLSKGSYSLMGPIFGASLSLIFTVQMGFLISGSQINPAVSMFFWVLGELSWKEFIVYTIAQTMGSYFGAAITFAVYYDAINDFDGGIRHVGGPNDTAGIFATFPKPYLTVRGGLVDLIVSTAVLSLTVHAVIDPRNKIPKWAQPSLLGMGLLITVFGFVMNSGSSLNPARDFGPRLFLLCAGYGWKVISYNNYKWFWIPIVAPTIGGLVGTFLYKSIISPFMPELEKKDGDSYTELDIPEKIVIENTRFHDTYKNVLG